MSEEENKNSNFKSLMAASGLLSLLVLFPSSSVGQEITNAVVADNPGVVIDLGASLRGAAAFGGADEDEFVDIDNIRITAGIDNTDYGVGADLTAQYAAKNDSNAFDQLDASIHADLGILGTDFDFLKSVTVGRFLAPQDRAGLAGDYGQTAWTLPTVVSKYASVGGYGRLDGAAIHGGVDFNAPEAPTVGALPINLGYSFGVFQGVENDAGDKDNALFAARVDAGSTVSDVAVNLGFALQTQNDAIVRGEDYTGWNIDGEITRAVTADDAAGLPTNAEGTASLSGGYYNYDLDDVAYVPGTGFNEGDGFYIQAAYDFDYAFELTDALALSPEPFFRYQRFDFDGAASGKQTRYDYGLNFVLDAATNTMLSVNLWNEKLLGEKDNGVIVGLQFVF